MNYNIYKLQYIFSNNIRNSDCDNFTINLKNVTRTRIKFDKDIKNATQPNPYTLGLVIQIVRI